MRVRARLADVWTARARTTRARTRTASTTATARARGGSEDARLVVDADSSGRVVGVDATSSRVPEGAYAGVDPLAASLGALAVWASARARSSGRRAAAAERRARAAEARCQELEWRLRVATSERDAGERRPRAVDRRPPVRAPDAVPDAVPDARDVIIEGLRMETEALRAALAHVRSARSADG